MLARLGSLGRYFIISYRPDPSAGEFKTAAQEQERGGLRVRVAIPDGPAGRKYFGVPLARRGIQPVWVEVTNATPRPYRLQCVALDPAYFSPLEAAAANHYSGLKRLVGFGFLAWVFLPVILLLAAKMLTVVRANRRMDAFFRGHAFRLRPVPPGATQSGFVYTTRTEGTKAVHVRLLGPDGTEEFDFAVPCTSLRADHRRIESNESAGPEPDLAPAKLREYLERLPAATTDARSKKSGDPVNLVVVAELETILGVFGARWDETEVISLASCRRTVRAFLLGQEYRYSPVSPLYLFGRSQDFALQRVRDSINERLHLRLWRAPVRFRGKPVWVGQVSRDIGVRFTRHTWNLMTHRVDPDVDEARDYVVEDLIHAGRAEIAAYVDGVGPCEPAKPRRNLTGDPYFTDGKRVAVLLSENPVTPHLLALFGEPNT
jgi:hypothetical protein